jgi:hypothetical protein
MEKTYSVSVRYGQLAKSYSDSFQTKSEYAKGWRSVLQQAHGNGEVRCLCPGHGDKRLSVRYFAVQDSYFLARYPNSGEEHSRDCRFFALDVNKSGLGGYHAGVIDEQSDGTYKITLGIGLTIKEPVTAVDTDEPTPSAGSARATQRSMRLLGLLHFLWNEAALNVWWPAMRGKRTVATVSYRLNETATRVLAGQTKLSDVLLTAAHAPNGREAERNRLRLKNAIANHSRLIVIAPLAKYKEEPKVLTISGFNGIPFLDLSPALWAATTKRFRRAADVWRAGGDVFAIVQCEPSADMKSANVVGLALMQVSSTWIPVDSSYELKIAEMLASDQHDRAFVKPLRFDADEDEVFPDFVLLDTAKDTPMEVFGRADEAYELRMQEKIEYFQKHFGLSGWWCWHAARDPDGRAIPSFPEKASRSR